MQGGLKSVGNGAVLVLHRGSDGWTARSGKWVADKQFDTATDAQSSGDQARAFEVSHPPKKQDVIKES